MKAHILGCIFSMLFSNFRVRGRRTLPIPPMMALTEFFHVDTETNVCPLLVLWYLISSLLWMYLCFFMHKLCILCSGADAVSTDNWPIIFKVLCEQCFCIQVILICI